MPILTVGPMPGHPRCVVLHSVKRAVNKHKGARGLVHGPSNLNATFTRPGRISARLRELAKDLRNGHLIPRRLAAVGRDQGQAPERQYRENQAAGPLPYHVLPVAHRKAPHVRLRLSRGLSTVPRVPASRNTLVHEIGAVGWAGFRTGAAVARVGLIDRGVAWPTCRPHYASECSSGCLSRSSGHIASTSPCRSISCALSEPERYIRFNPHFKSSDVENANSGRFVPITQAPNGNILLYRILRPSVKLCRLLVRPTVTHWYIEAYVRVLSCAG
jgi:hypothetical protein